VISRLFIVDILLTRLLYSKVLKEVKMNGCGCWLDHRVKLESV